MPKISVIVPIYNVEKLLEGCLASIRQQTFPDFEALCVDDGSTDRSGDLADEFAKRDSRFRVIHQENKGLSGARNTALNQAKGDYVFFCDSDDYMHPQTLEVLLEAIESTRTDVAGCGFVKTGKLYPVSFPIISPADRIPEIISNPFEAYLTRRDIMTGVWTRLYRRRILKNVRFVEGIYFEDVPFTTHIMATIKNYALIKAPMYYYYQNPASILHTSFNLKKAESYVTVIRTVWEDMRTIRPEMMERVRKIILNGRVKMMLNGIYKKQKDKAERKRILTAVVPELKRLMKNEIISYQGLKLKHKIRLFRVLHKRG